MKGFEVVGALVIGDNNLEANACKAAEAARKFRKFLSSDYEQGNCDIIGASVDLTTGKTHFFVSASENPTKIEAYDTVVYDENPEKYIWERGCLIKCELGIKLPVYVPVNKPSGIFCTSFYKLSHNLNPK